MHDANGGVRRITGTGTESASVRIMTFLTGKPLAGQFEAGIRFAHQRRQPLSAYPAHL
jgi:hypothetical protein